MVVSVLRSLPNGGEREISSRQVGGIVALSRIATVVLVLPVATLAEPSRDIWLVSLVGTVLGVAVGYAVTTLAEYGPGEDAFGIMSGIIGPPAARVASLLLAAFFGWLGAMVLRELGELFRAAVMSETPIWALVGAAGAVAAWISMLRPVGIARTTDVILPMILVSLAIIVPFVITDVDLRRLTPVLETGLPLVAKGVLSVVAWFGEVLLVLNLLPYVRDPGNLRRAVVKGQVLAGAVLVATSALTVAVLGRRGAAETVSPMFVLAKVARLPSLGLERFEILVLAAWVGAEVVKGAVLAYAAAASTARALSPRPLAAPALAGPSGPVILLAVGAVIVVASIVMARNIVELRVLGLASVPYRAALVVGLPLVLLIAARLRRGRARGRSGDGAGKGEAAA